jgi:hypothetical protein
VQAAGAAARRQQRIRHKKQEKESTESISRACTAGVMRVSAQPNSNSHVTPCASPTTVYQLFLNPKKTLPY